MTVYDNVALDSAASTTGSCGVKATSNYGMGTRTTAVNTAQDTLGTTYTAVDFDFCIPNWWQ